MLPLQSDPMSLNLVFLIAFMAVMYFFFIRPQVKKQKAQDSFVTNLSKGDEVVTSSGIIGRINKIESKAITLQLDQKTFIQVIPGAINKDMTESYSAPVVDKK